MSNTRILISALFLSLASILPLIDFLTQPAKDGEDKKAAAEDDLKAGEEREVEIANGVKMKFCWIPSGEAQLGSPKTERDAVLKHLIEAKLVDNGKEPEGLSEESDGVRGKFKTKGFWLGRYPVTQTEWKAMMGDNPSFFNGESNNKAKGIDTSRFPVENVSWDDCQKFLEKLNKRTEVEKVFGKAGQFVLPHEDQWEYACRGGKGNKGAFYFGNELNGTQANCNGNYPYGTDKMGAYKERTTEVGSYAKDWPHPWGLCDMHGNVCQWCENKYEQSDNRVLRGGAWISFARYCRSAGRFRRGPVYRDYYNGFRVCLPLEK